MAIRMFGRGIDHSREGSMTTDPEEGRRQIEAMKPPAIKVGDKVRLKAGGERVMLVIELYDYGNKALCRWETTDVQRERFPVSALAKVDE
jgi:uncharacterized protein YodC (DUF2158 family)